MRGTVTPGTRRRCSPRSAARCWRWRPATCGGSAASAGPGDVPVTSTLILDCDGVLADTERYGHLVAFNQTFDEFGLPVRWSVADYQEKVRIGGGKERMASLLTPEFVAAAGLPDDPAGQQDAIAAWHRRKTAIYAELVAAG